MPEPRQNPYSFRKSFGTRKAFVFRSFRMEPEMFAQIEALAGEESISVNALCNAVMGLTLTFAETAAGREAIHQACTDWRARYEHTETTKRRARQAGE